MLTTDADPQTAIRETGKPKGTHHDMETERPGKILAEAQTCA
jgi:hypothetical protein